MRTLTGWGIRRRLQDERGISAIVIGAFAVALFGMVALVVDVGFLMIERRIVVRGVDAAVLAAAQSYAVNEDGASPGANDAPAMSQANALATANEPDIALPPDEYEASFPCADPDVVASLSFPESVGCVTAAYHAIQSLVFAPVLGIDPESQVGWRATAMWGPAGSAEPAPMALDYSTFFPCYGENEPEDGTQCAFWFDNESVTAETWGFLNLDQWDVPPDATCQSASQTRIQEWIQGIDVPTLHLRNPPPTYVCRHPGTAAFNPPDGALEQQIGKIKIFPLTDPDQEILGSHRKYAVIAFTALRIDDVIRGDDPAAFGAGGICRHTRDFLPGDTIDIDLIPTSNQGNPCPDGATQDKVPPEARVEPPVLTRGNTTFQPGVDYEYDPDTRVITWLADAETNVRIEFEWQTAGACGMQQSDPNARCLVLSWAGQQMGGGLPGEGPAVPGALQAVRLAR